MIGWTQLPLDIRWHAVSGLDQFKVGDNAAAVAAIRRLADGKERLPVYLYGEPGSGKTHLLHAAARAVGETGRPVAYVPGALIRQRPWALDGLEGMALVCIDALDALNGADAAEEALFHLYNRCLERETALLFAALAHPGSLALGRDDLRTRLGWGLCVQVKPMSDADLLDALRERARQRGLELPPASARYLLGRLPRLSTALFPVLEDIDRAALAAKRRLTIPFLRDYLERVRRPLPRAAGSPVSRT
jgi:DnaA-homolog protein